MHQDIGIGLPATQIARPKPKDYYPVYTGRMIYEQITMSGLNSVPVQMHLQRALRGFTATGTLPYKQSEVTELLLVEGSAVFYLDEDGDWECMENLITADDEDIYQLIMPYMPEYAANMSAHDCTLRHFVATPDGWIIYDTPFNTWAATGKESEVPAGSKPAQEVRVYENGRGILYKPQWIWQRLEEIRWGIRQETSDFALSLLIIGMVSPNPEAALAKLESGKRIANIPGSGNPRVERVGDSRIPDQLDMEYDKLEAAYFRMCYLFDTANQPERPVGLDLQLRLEPQAAFVEDLRTKIVDVYRMLDYTGEIKFTPLETQTVTDKATIANTMIALTEARLIDSSRAAAIIAATFPQ